MTPLEPRPDAMAPRAVDLDAIHLACKEAGVAFDPEGGVGGGPVVQPTSETSLGVLIAALSSRSARANVRLLPVGTGGQLSWCRPDQCMAPDGSLQLAMPALLGGSGASGVVEYVPGDGTLTALAGADVSVLRATVAEGGHRLTPALFGAATLGGVLAAGRSGLDQHSLGPTRHHLLGMRMIDGSGRHLRSGGRLVKNVTGFDLHRLHAGARGIFGPIVEASMRLMPEPEAEQYLISGPCASAAEAVELALEVRGATKVREQALFVRDRATHVLLAGRSAQVDADRRRLERLLPGLVERDAGPGAENFHLAGAQQAGVRLSTVPSRVAGTVKTLETWLGDLASAVIVPGVAHVDLPTELLSEASSWPDRLDARLDPRAPLPLALRDPSDPSGLPERAQDRWRGRLIEAFDPAGLFQIEGFPARG